MGVSILVVEDELLVAGDVRKILTGFGYEVPVLAATGLEALHAADEHVPDLVLMDIRLKGSLDGIETAARLQERHAVPVVYLTSHSDDDTLERAKRTGPYGFVVKPFTDRELRTSIEVALGRHEMERQSAKRSRLLALANEELVVRSEERKRESDRLRVVARTDPLTEAANRLHLHEDLEAIADRARRYGHQYCAAFCDIDGFKSYNDSFGHLAGDRAIRLVSLAFKRELRKGDAFYRYGGDEFLVLLPEQTLATAWDCVERVRSAVASIPVTADEAGVARPLTISVGIADFRLTKDEDAIPSWLQRADAALYRAKARGRNCTHLSGQTPHPLPNRAPTPSPEIPKP